MGVISCSRTACDEIMCQYQTPHGNLCHKCKDEFIEQVDRSKDIEEQLIKFIETRKTDYEYKDESVEDYFQRYSRY